VYSFWSKNNIKCDINIKNNKGVIIKPKKKQVTKSSYLFIYFQKQRVATESLMIANSYMNMYVILMFPDLTCVKCK